MYSDTALSQVQTAPHRLTLVSSSFLEMPWCLQLYLTTPRTERQELKASDKRGLRRNFRHSSSLSIRVERGNGNFHQLTNRKSLHCNFKTFNDFFGSYPKDKWLVSISGTVNFGSVFQPYVDVDLQTEGQQH